MSSSRAPLEALLAAPKKSAIDEFLCSCAAEIRNPPSWERITEISATFGVTAIEAAGLQRAGAVLVGDAVYANGSAEETAALFPDSFHADLRSLLVKVVQHRLPEWCATSLAAGGVSSMPQLQSASWLAYRVPVDEADGPTRPALNLNLKIGKSPSGAPGRTVNVEMSKEQVDSMLEGLNKVKEQLAAA